MTHSHPPAHERPSSLEHTPPQVEAIHGQVEAVRTEVVAAHREVDADLPDKVGALHTEIAGLHDEVGELHTEVSDLHEEVADFPAELKAVQDQVDHLELALDTNRHISAAVGIVMERLRLTQDDAFQTLVKASQARNIKLRALADQIVETGSLPDGAHATKANPGG